MKSPFVTLASLDRNRVTIGNLPGLKSIVRVTTPRLIKWYLVLPAVGDYDCRCILVRKQDKRWADLTVIDKIIIESEAARLEARDQSKA